MNEALSKAIEALNAVIGYPESRQHLGTIIHDQAREALSALSALQEARPVAEVAANADRLKYIEWVPDMWQRLSLGDKLYAHPQPAQQDARDAERYRFLRDVPYTPRIAEVMRFQMNAAMDNAIDAALAAAKEKQ